VKDNPVCWTRSGTGSAGSTTASGPKRRTWIGSGVSCCITIRGTVRSCSSTRTVLGEPLSWLEGIESAKRPARLPVVVTRQEVESILAHLSGTVGLMVRLLYGTGMRIMECCAPAGEVMSILRAERSWFGRARAGRIA
jgi:integrase